MKLKRSIIFALCTISLISLSACGKKSDTNPTQPSLEVIAPTETEPETIVDKLEEPTKSYVAPTIGTTEVERPNGEKVVVGITETLEDNSYIAITPENDIIVSIGVPELSSGHEYTESEAIAVEGLVQYWSENNVSKEVLAARLEDGVYAGLSETDKEEIVEFISSSNPHNNPEITEVETPESESEAEESSESAGSSDGMTSSERSRAQRAKYGEGAQLGVGEPDPNLNLQAN